MLLVFAFILPVLLSKCALAPQQTAAPDAVATSVAGTVQAMLQARPAGIQETATPKLEPTATRLPPTPSESAPQPTRIPPDEELKSFESKLKSALEVRDLELMKALMSTELKIGQWQGQVEKLAPAEAAVKIAALMPETPTVHLASADLMSQVGGGPGTNFASVLYSPGWNDGNYDAFVFIIQDANGYCECSLVILRPFSERFSLPSGEAKAFTNVNLRTGPSTLNGVLDTIKEGMPLKIIGIEPGKQWVMVQTPDEKVGWMSVDFLVVEIPLEAIMVAQPPQDSYTIQGSIKDLEGMPISGIGVALWRDIPEASELRTDAVSTLDGSFYAYIPRKLEGKWNAGVVSVACTSNIVDTTCNYQGWFVEPVIVVDAPQTITLEFVFDKNR